jgi:DNA replication and repair protein RecF
MNLGKFEVRNIRNLHAVSLQLTPRVNVFYGNNGSGKTSLLESVWMLGLGRSFRAKRHGTLINHEAQECTVFGEIENEKATPVGIRRGRDGSRDIRIGGNRVAQVSELARVLPLQLINTDSIRLLSGPPDGRRRFLNWGVFHVEPEFHDGWRRYQHCLKQRNVLLRNGKIDKAQLDVWSRELVASAEIIDRHRGDYTVRLAPLFQDVLKKLSPDGDITLTYYCGWDRSQGLADVLAEDLDGDINRGFTLHGPQRADLQMGAGNRNAGDVLSRGELKLVACGMLASQVFLLRQETGRDGVLLIDDLASELDPGHRRDLCGLIEESGSQILVTSVEKNGLEGCWRGADRRVFHVEHGAIEAEE